MKYGLSDGELRRLSVAERNAEPIKRHTKQNASYHLGKALQADLAKAKRALKIALGLDANGSGWGTKDTDDKRDMMRRLCKELGVEG